MEGVEGVELDDFDQHVESEDTPESSELKPVAEGIAELKVDKQW